jgi:heterodisulfide reductase subunit A
MVDNKKKVAIIGGGLAGMEAAVRLTSLGYDVNIIEKSFTLGGNLANWNVLFPDYSPSSNILNKLKCHLRDKANILFGTELNIVERKDKGFLLHLSDGEKVDADAILVATGFQLFPAIRKEEYGYMIYPNVITSADLEELLKQEKPLHTKDNRLVKKIAFIHCVGSRDEKVGNTYCSKVCCATAIKQEIEVAKLNPDADIYSFYMDLRMFDRKFEDMYSQAQIDYGIHFIRGRLSEVSEKADSTLYLKVEDTLLGRPLRLTVDMVVLMVGMEASQSTPQLARIMQIPTGEDRFFESENYHLLRNITRQPGIFVAGCATGPKSSGETIADARSAAMEIINYLNNN